MSKFKAGDVVTPIIPSSFQETHPHISIGKSYVVRASEKHGNLLQIEDDFGIDWWADEWFKMANVSTQEVSAESLRDKWKSLEEEKNKCNQRLTDVGQEQKDIETSLKEMGFVLANKQDTPIEVDYSNPKNWKKGDTLICVDTECFPFLTLGAIYTLSRKYDVMISIVDSEGDTWLIPTCDLNAFNLYAPF